MIIGEEKMGAWKSRVEKWEDRLEIGEGHCGLAFPQGQPYVWILYSLLRLGNVGKRFRASSFFLTENMYQCINSICKTSSQPKVENLNLFGQFCIFKRTYNRTYVLFYT